MGDRKQKIKFIDEFKEISMGDIEGVLVQNLKKNIQKNFMTF